MALESGSSTVLPNNDNHVLLSDNNDGPDDDRPNVRSIPPWVCIPDTHDTRQLSVQPLVLPEHSVVPHHQYLPESNRKLAKGRRYDQYRNAEPALLDQTLAESNARWLPFIVSGPQYNARDVEGARLMPDSWMEQNIAWWSGDGEDHADGHGEKRRTWLLDFERRRGSVTHAKRTMLKNPFIPLVLRLIVTAFTLAALGLGGRVYHQTHSVNTSDSEIGCRQRASTYMAIIVDSIAVPYIAYVTWDEYTSKPLGLRSATAKTALLLIDLYFIVFYGSNLSLAFDALTDSRWACYSGDHMTCPLNQQICDSQSGLVSVLLIALVAWILTFTISVLRVVKKLRPDE